MTITPLAEDPLEILIRHIADGTLNATPEGIALVAFVCDFVATEPHFVGLFLTSDGTLMGQHNDEIGANVAIGTLHGVLDQLLLVCRNCGLTDAQTQVVLEAARKKIT